MGYSRENPDRRGWGHGVSRGIEETACGNSRDRLKRKWKTPGKFRCSGKTDVEFQWVLDLTLDFPRGVTHFWRISRGESLFSLEFLSDNLKNSRGEFQKSVSSTSPPPSPPIWILSGKAQSKVVTYILVN